MTSGRRPFAKLDVNQDGARVWGSGRKVSENGVPVAPEARTPIGFDGSVQDR